MLLAGAVFAEETSLAPHGPRKRKRKAETECYYGSRHAYSHGRSKAGAKSLGSHIFLDGFWLSLDGITNDGPPIESGSGNPASKSAVSGHRARDEGKAQ